MGIKRKIEENGVDAEKKTKLEEEFPIGTFIKNLKDPESSFLGNYDPLLFAIETCYLLNTFSSERIQ